MAKSLRSKRRRKMRAIKRERYAVKELAKLKQVLATGGDELEEIAEMTTTEAIKKKSSNDSVHRRIEEGTNEKAEAEVTMEVDQEKRVFNKNLLDKFGNYPEWMSQRQIKKRKVLRKKGKVGLKQIHKKKK